MKRIYINELKDHVGETVEIAGFVDTYRDHGKLVFIDLRDLSGKVQMVALPNHEAAHKTASELKPEWVIAVTGKVNKRPEKMVNEKEANGSIEIEITAIEVISKAAELPFELSTDLNLDTYLDYLPITLRPEARRAVFKVQAEILVAFRAFLNKERFTEFQAPKIVGGDAEGGAGVFHVDYLNGKTAYLATSPQLYKQIMVGVFERVYAVGNVFRAEKHSTTRHLNEYTSMDLEMGFIENHVDVMDMTGELMHAVFDHLKKTCAHEFELLGATLPAIPKHIPHMKLREAQKLLEKEHNVEIGDAPDLEPQHERWLSEYAKKEFDSDFIFITHFPITKTAFYAYEDPDDLGYSRYFDLLFRGIEIVSGGQREHRYDTLVSKLTAKGLDPDKFSFYLQAFKFGLPPHGGFGMGLERLTEKFLELDNVKKATLFPREINRIDTLLSLEENQEHAED